MSTTERLINARIFDGDATSSGNDLLLFDGRIKGMVAATTPLAADEVVTDVEGRLLAPGLIDLQVNGGGGVLFNDRPTTAGVRSMVAAHRATGTTGMLPTLITDRPAVMDAALEAIDQALQADEPGVLGIHLEGPCLNPRFKGVHDESRMQAFDAAMLQRIASLPGGRTLVTLAPETVSTGFIRELTEAGVIVFGGHSAATYEETLAAIEAGLAGFTHLYNAMSPFTSRAPGMVGAALASSTTVAGIIADGHHVHPASVAIAVAAKPRGQMVLVTDAMPSVGSDQTMFDLFDVPVRAEDGRCVTDDGTLAGSDIGLIDAVRNAIEFASLDLAEALRMASAYPARVLGLDDELGYLRPGYRASLIELDSELAVRRSWIDGERQEHGPA